MQVSRNVALAWLLVCVLAATAFAACGRGSDTPTPTRAIAGPLATEPATVRAGVVGALGEAGQYLAQSQGYFATQQLAVEFVRIDPSSVLIALIAGQVDAGCTRHSGNRHGTAARTIGNASGSQCICGQMERRR